jgi:hypothetical protein
LFRNKEKLRKVFLILALLFTGLSSAYDNGATSEKGSGVTILIVTLLSISIAALIILIIRKAKSNGRKIIIEGITEGFGKEFSQRSPLYNNDSSSVYSKRRGSRGTHGRHESIGGNGGTGGIW